MRVSEDTILLEQQRQRAPPGVLVRLVGNHLDRCYRQEQRVYTLKNLVRPRNYRRKLLLLHLQQQPVRGVITWLL